MNLHPELGSGPLDAALWVVGRDEGFGGPAGFALDKALAAGGIQRDSVRVETLNPEKAKSPEGVEWGRVRLDALVAAQRPKLIVTLGDEAARWALGDAIPDDSITAFRGYLWDTARGRVLTTIEPHDFSKPVGLGQLPWSPWRALLNLDTKRAGEELRAGCPALTTRAVTIVTEPRELEELKDAITPAGWLACDIENHADLTLACMGFAPTPERAWVISATSAWQLAAIRSLCESSVPKVLQNAQYDTYFLRHFCGIELRSLTFDTMLAWHSLQPELAGKKLQTSARRKTFSRTTVKSLKFLSSIYTRDAWWKSYDFTSEEERYTLCGRDCCVTLEIALKQVVQLDTA